MVPEALETAAAGPAPPAPAARPRYLAQDCPLTVRQGLAEYRALMPDLIDEAGLDGEAYELFHNHDIAHVVFGCDISLRQETMIDTWTVMGTDVGFAAYLDYIRVPQAQEILRETGYATSAWVALRALPDVARVIRNARRMKGKWPWTDHARYLDRPLAEVRAELGIELVP